ncbi:MAG: Uma2 family endonuclease [Bacteroidota bacterium]
MEEVNESILEYAQLDLDGTYTYTDYLRWQFKERVELIKGKIRKMSPTPSILHQKISYNITGILYNIFKNQPCQCFAAPFDVRLPIPSAQKDTTVVQPDLCIICDLSKLNDLRGCNGAPDLIIEILSPGNTKHEINTKFSLYEESGVKEYWLVEHNDKAIFIYTLINEKYIGLQPLTEGQIITSPLFPEMKIAVDDVFEGV